MLVIFVDETNRPLLVSDITLSKGEQGPNRYDNRELSEIRELENKLGLYALFEDARSEIELIPHQFEHPDTRLCEIGHRALEEVVQLDLIKPEETLIVTFDSFGADGHFDHIAVNGIARAIAEQTGNPILEFSLFAGVDVDVFEIPQSQKQYVAQFIDAHRSQYGEGGEGLRGIPHETLLSQNASILYVPRS